MKKVILIGGLSIFAAACSNAAQQTTVTNANAATTIKSDNSGLVASGHSTAQSSTSAAQPPTASTNPTAPDAPANSAQSGGNPMERAIDTGKFDQEIVRAEKEFKAKPKDETAKKALATAYADRAFALTEAAQYRAALGDFRRSLKLDATNEEARKAHDQIIGVFASLKREPPKEGEEPAPLPLNKGV